MTGVLPRNLAKICAAGARQRLVARIGTQVARTGPEAELRRSAARIASGERDQAILQTRRSVELDLRAIPVRGSQ